MVWVKLTSIWKRAWAPGTCGVNMPGLPEIPEAVFEELLVNALVHRDYLNQRLDSPTCLRRPNRDPKPRTPA